MKTVLILGGSGLLGTNLSLQLKGSCKVIKHGFSKNADVQCDLTDADAVKGLIKKCSPDVIVNTIAETSVEKCEQEPLSAFNLNVLPLINLKKALHKLNLKPHLIHISTDHMYDKSFSREDELIFKNNYAVTKFWAERELSELNAICLRTNFFGGDTDFKKSFSGWAKATLELKKTFSGFSDVFFSPLNVATFGGVLEAVIENKTTGVFNLGSSTELSKYEFIQKIADLYSLDGSLCKPILYKDSRIQTERPLRMSMNVSKIEKSLNIKLPSLEEEIQKLLS